MNDTRQTEKMDMLHQVKDSQHQLEQKVLDIDSRLAALESLVESLDAPQCVTKRLSSVRLFDGKLPF